jgi:hypothetical protein
MMECIKRWFKTYSVVCCDATTPLHKRNRLQTALSLDTPPVALASALPKLLRILTDFKFTSLENLVESLDFDKLPVVDLR